MIDSATAAASRTLVVEGEVRREGLQPGDVLCGRGRHSGNARLAERFKEFIWSNHFIFFKEVGCNPVEGGTVGIYKRGVDIPSNYVVLATTFMKNHIGNKLFDKLTSHAFESYGSRFNPSWIAERVVDGVSNHNPPLIFCFPNTTSPRSTGDLVPVSQYATIDLVSFVLRMWHRGRNGYWCLQNKLAAIEDLLICQGKYSAGELHEALFFYSLDRNVKIADKKQKQDELNFPKGTEATTAPQMKLVSKVIKTARSSDTRVLASSDGTGKGCARKRRSVDGCDGRNHDGTRKKKTRNGNSNKKGRLAPLRDSLTTSSSPACDGG